MKQFTIVTLGLLSTAFALPPQQDAQHPDGSGNGPWTCCCANTQCTVSWGVTSTAKLNANLGGDWSPVDDKYHITWHVLRVMARSNGHTECGTVA
ncbi:hypothetical protein Landi51_13675 [Colletotrichum acutatum]